ncbi:MAG: cytochrome c [Gammaproteobacteria bacterium]|nr:cytochrome c [Gammaproteobacteria bacterium]
MKIAVSIILFVVFSLIGITVFAFSGILNVSAISKEPAAIRWVLENTRKYSVRSRADDIKTQALVNEYTVSAGARAFNDMCAGCHGAPGKSSFLGARDMNPPPPNLSEVAPNRSDKELFWVVKNGIRMTGMPAWGPSHTDMQLWELVAFIKKLPEMTPDKYMSLVENTQNDGHDHEHSETNKTDEHGHPH